MGDTKVPENSFPKAIVLIIKHCISKVICFPRLSGGTGTLTSLDFKAFGARNQEIAVFLFLSSGFENVKFQRRGM